MPHDPQSTSASTAETTPARTLLQHAEEGTWQPLAWNGVDLAIPEDWTPEQLGRVYLRACGDDGLALECKWQQGKSVSRAKALKRLRKALKSMDVQMDGSRQPKPLRKAFKELEGRGFAVQPYSWGTDSQRGAGALLQCGACGRSTLMQFVDVERNVEQAAAMVRSFSEHREDGGLRFELFGICALVPAGFTLKSFSFKPGQYRLEFEGDRSRKRAGLVLERVGPASVLFAGAGFAEWATQRFAHMGEGGVLENDSWQGGPAVVWLPRRRGLPGMLHGLFTRRKPAHVRAWQPGEANDVLCVALTGGGRRAKEVFEEVCSSYALAQETQSPDA